MKPNRLPVVDRALVRVFLGGRDTEFLVGDLIERFEQDLASGVPKGRAQARLRRQVIASAIAWWRPTVVAARRQRKRLWAQNRRFRMSDSAGDGADMGGAEPMGIWVQDFRIAARSLARRPGFAAGVVLTLGLGIGATTTIFSVVDGVILRPLPYDDPGQLVAIGATLPNREWDDEEAGLQHLAGISMLNFRDHRTRARSFQSLAAIESRGILLPDMGNGPELVEAAAVSSEMFEILGATPALGRTFQPSEHSTAAPNVLLITYGAWQRRFGGDPDIVGSPLPSVGSPITIVGVLPRDFEPPEALFPTVPDFWLPLQPDHPRYQSRGRRTLFVIGRLGPGITPGQARAEARDVAAELAIEYPDDNVSSNGGHLGIGVNGLHEETIGTAGKALGIYLGAAALLLLLSVMNAATLLLARALDRTRELGVRMALGAGRGRVMRLLMSEAGLLSAAGGVIGVLFAYGGVEAFLLYAPSSIPRMSTVTVDARVMAVAAFVSLGTGFAAGILPAVRLTRSGAWDRFHGSARTSSEPTSRLRAALVGGQMAVAMLLLSGAGLLFTSFVKIVSVEPGFEPDGLITMNIGLKRPGAMEEEVWQGWDLALAELAAVPGVESVAGTSGLPFQPPSWGPRLLLPGDPPDIWRESIAGYVITPGYLQTMGTRLVSGRDVERLDGPTAERVMLVNETFVRTQLGGADALGVIVRDSEGEVESAIRIVGVVEDVVQTAATEGPRAAVYLPYTQVDWPGGLEAVVRTDLSSEAIMPELRKAVARFSPIVPPRDLGTIRDRMSSTRTTPRFQAMLIGAFAFVALLLASAGLYGSLAHEVGRRQRELGVRMALGAGRSGVLHLVLRRGMTVALVGLAVGLVGSVGSTRVLTGYLYGVEPNDPMTLFSVAAVLVLVSIAACLIPASRATKVDPVEVLRAE